jgi:hypothetical protein
MGMTGLSGSTGPMGVTGPTGPSLGNFARVYNLSAVTVDGGKPVLFDSNGMLSGFTHSTVSSQVYAGNTGIYHVTFSLTPSQVSQFLIYVNGSAISDSLYGTGSASQQNNGDTIVSLNSGDFVELYNSTTSSAVTLPTQTGGIGTNVNASMTITQLK